MKNTNPLIIILFFAASGLGAQALEGAASWYGPGFHGRLTANGERYNMYAMTAAHKTLPFGTLVEVTLLSNGLKVTVRINDRGPFVEGRIIDLSRAAAERIGLIEEGVGSVSLKILKEETPQIRSENSQEDRPAQDLPLYVQVGAYSAQENAQDRAEIGVNLGLQMSIYYASPYYRVFVLTNQSDKKSVLELLENRTNWDYLVKELPPNGEKLTDLNN
jgi:rare lipoprotein A (peptidoglycan hydrolase)